MAVLLVLVGLALSAGGAMAATALAKAAFCPGATTFPCKVRLAGRVGDPRPYRWHRQGWRGAWAHDVLVLERGVLVPRGTALTVRMPEEALHAEWSGEVRCLGRNRVVVLLRLDDNFLGEVATAGDHRDDLAGPFLAAAIPGLPRGPRGDPNPGR